VEFRLALERSSNRSPEGELASGCDRAGQPLAGRPAPQGRGAMTDAIERLQEIVEELQEMLSAATAVGDSETEGRLIVALTALGPLARPAVEPQ
jgi:hypothetical protein